MKKNSIIMAIILMSVLPGPAFSAVSLVSPSGTVTTDQPTLVWEENSDASWYKLFIWDSSQERVFSQWVETEGIHSDYPDADCSGGTCSATMTAGLADGSYQWFVRYWSEDDPGEWSDAMDFTVSAAQDTPSRVTLVSPSGTVSLDALSFIWNEATGADWYKLFIWDGDEERVYAQWYETAGSNAGYPDATCTGGICTADVSADLGSGGYQWFVRAWNASGSGEWSDAMAFTVGGSGDGDGVRVPAEWEPHAATWIQWPGQWESDMRSAFADVINVIQAYEPVHLLTSTESEQREAAAFLAENGVPDTNITWHIIPVDNAWMRDNGPIYVEEDGVTRIQNWKFDAWGGNFGSDVLYENDNQVPEKVGEYLGLAVADRQDYILEKGNLEFNGAGILVLNWDCQDDRNPNMTEAEHEAILKEAFGLTRIIWAYGHYEGEGTTGHIDGTARFTDEDTIVITQQGSDTEENLVTACEAAGLEVVRYAGDVNWLVGNGFVAAVSSGSTSMDATLKTQLETLFPGRDIHLIDVSSMVNNGGAIHCITNDQPVIQ